MLSLGALLASVALAVSQLDSKNLFSSLISVRVWPLLLVAAVLVWVFSTLERRAEDPVIHPKLLGSRQVVLTTIFAAGAGLGEAGMVFLPALAVAALGMSTQSSSFMLLPVVLALVDRHTVKTGYNRFNFTAASADRNCQSIRTARARRSVTHRWATAVNAKTSPTRSRNA